MHGSGIQMAQTMWHQRPSSVGLRAPPRTGHRLHTVSARALRANHPLHKWGECISPAFSVTNAPARNHLPARSSSSRRRRRRRLSCLGGGCFRLTHFFLTVRAEPGLLWCAAAVAATFLLHTVAFAVHGKVTPCAEQQRVAIVAASVPAHAARSVVRSSFVTPLAPASSSTPERHAAESDLDLLVVQRRRRILPQRLFLERVHPLFEGLLIQ